MRLALIAGRGHLPATVARAQPQRPYIAALKGFEPQGLKPDVLFRLETLGSLFKTLKRNGITDVCLCGAIERPKLSLSRLDLRTWLLVPAFLRALKLGDDGALRVLMGLFEKHGFNVLGADTLLPDLTLLKGVYTTARPSAQHARDAAVADDVLRSMGAADLGQACVISSGSVVAREDERGTDEMLKGLISKQDRRDQRPDPLSADAKEVRAWVMSQRGTLTDAERGGILFKAPKPEQDRRADLPTIGPGTAVRAAEAGLDGIVIEEGGVIVLSKDELLAILDAMGMFLWVREAT